MEDMEEYSRCLDVIGNCNHIMALDEISDNASNDDVKVQEVKNDLKIEVIDSQEKPVEHMETAAGVGDHVTSSNAGTSNFLKDSEDAVQTDHFN